MSRIQKPLRIGLVFAAFPVKDVTPYKYFLLLLNRLQRSCEFEFLDYEKDDVFLHRLGSGTLDADEARSELEEFGSRVRKQVQESMAAFDLAREMPKQLIA